MSATGVSAHSHYCVHSHSIQRITQDSV